MKRSAVVLLTAAVAALPGCWTEERGGFGPDHRPAPATAEPTRPPTTAPPAGTGPEAGRRVTVSTPGFSYEPAELALPANQTVVLELVNSDSRPHTLTVNGLNLQLVANPGETVRLPLQTPASSGRFTMYCSIPGHRDRGHMGTIRVG